ncbi:MAG: putative toxin-antitoxin system toxin component, PIN family [Candidatus Riflebacteria bacterium]|nr:putative toxin-antitoxin system toxin component, PIN family [Candidatus Riflebacteria bacterium]
MKVVLDTNVFISSFLGKGPPHQIVKRWTQGEFDLCLTPEIIDEYVEILNRAGVEEEPYVKEVLDIIKRQGNIVFSSKPMKCSVVMDDPDDDKFIACALSCEAKIIVSGDSHLLNIIKYIDIEIIRSRAFLNILERNSDNV